MVRRKVMVIERKKPKDPRADLLEAAAEAWQKKDEFENILRQVELVKEAEVGSDVNSGHQSIHAATNPL